MKLLLKRLRKLIAVPLMLTLMLFVSACATTNVTVTLSDHPLCHALSWHEADTPTTQREIFTHNLKVEDPRICPPGE